MPYISPEDREYMVRTIIGEAEHEPAIGQIAATYTILNRLARGYANTAKGVVLSPWQYTTWHDRGKELMKIKPNNSRFQKVAANVDAAINGQVPDPTGGATHYLDPVWRAKHYKNQPSWSLEDKGIQIGSHVFHAPGQQGLIDNAVASGAPQQAQQALTAINRKPPQTTADAIPEPGGVPPGAKGSNEPMAFAETAAAGLRTPNGTPVVQAAFKPTDAGQQTPASPYASELDAIEKDADPASHAQPTQPSPYHNELNAIEEDSSKEPPAAGPSPSKTVESRSPDTAMHAGETPNEELTRRLKEADEAGGVSGMVQKVGIGGAKAIVNAADSILQGIQYVGQKGAEAIGAKETAKTIQGWRDELDKRLEKENKAYSAASGGLMSLAGAGEIGGTALTAIAAPGGVATKAGSAVKTILQGAAFGGKSAALASSSDTTPFWTQVLTGTGLGAAGSIVPAAGKFTSDYLKTHVNPQITGSAVGATLSALGIHEGGKSLDELWADAKVVGGLLATLGLGKAGPKAIGGASGKLQQLVPQSWIGGQ